MADFPPAFLKTNGNEGGVSYNPVDLGNVVVKGIVTLPTYRGIAPVPNPKWAGWKHITATVALLNTMPVYGSGAHSNWARYLDSKLAEIAILQQMVVDFYRINYWDKYRLGEIRSQGVAEWIYDHTVNAGARGIMWIQLAATVKPDGGVGPKTLAAINAAYPGDLLARAEDIAGAYRLDRAHNSPSQIQFLTGWLRRDGQPETIIALVKQASADGRLDDAEMIALKASMAATA
jgi:lysozyme family protein